MALQSQAHYDPQMFSAAHRGKTTLMVDPRGNFLSQLDIHSCRVELSQAPIVLLCGGKVPSQHGTGSASLRHAVTQAQTNFEVFRPEEITDWQTDAIYKNLLDFEQDLASICTLVVIVLESPGSIAELGAFSQFEELRDRLTVFAPSNMDPESFIELGILRYIEKESSSRVKRYPWNPYSGPVFDDEFVGNVVADIGAELNELKKSQKFNFSLRSHSTVLICELLRHFIALKEGEIVKYLGMVGNTVDDIHRFRGLLFLLEKFRVISKEVYSDSTFYVRGQEDFHRISLASKSGQKIDAPRIQVECSLFYKESTSERHRMQVIKKLNAEGRL